ncbi:MAG: OmpA family protein [Bacteroidales bacterium]|nr:OmpA family protein [Bacteroidales bacterium]
MFNLEYRAEMKNIVKYTQVLGLLLIASLAFGQNKEFNKKDCPDVKGLKEALKNIDSGDGYTELGDNKTALSFYLKAQEFNPNNADLNYKIGKCYWLLNKPAESIPYFTKAVELDPVGAGHAYGVLGMAYQATYQFDEAISAYQKARARLTPDEKKTKGNDLAEHIDQCNVGKRLIADSARVFIDNMGAAINSKYTDYAPIISADQSMLIFTSTRDNKYTKKAFEDGEYDENLWVSYRNGSSWSQAVDMGTPINTKENDATIGLSADGQKLFLFYGEKGGDIKYSERKGDAWSKPELFDAINSPNSHENSACFSYDGRTVYFSSTNNQRVQNYGEHDIFKCEMNEKGKWGKPVNLGPIINTDKDEVGVFMHPDGRTLYFASNGHETMGGYDIFYTVMQDDSSWSEPKNIGYPINTPGDEQFLVVDASGMHAYYSSQRAGGFGGLDVYMITFLGPEKKLNMTTENNLIAVRANPIQQEVVMEKSVEIKTARLTVVKGVVSDAFADPKKYLDAQIEITDNSTGKVLFTNNANATTGKFLIPLPSGKNYGIAVKKDGYLFHSENFDVPQATDYQEIILDIKLMPVAKDSKIVLRNVFFDTDKSTLKPMSYTELDKLVEILNNNPKMKIEIGGHTDNVGTKTYNQKLSQSRAEAVVNYLISKNISKDRLDFKGYGMDEPIASNDTADGRAQNRRVEFKIISNE